MTTKEEAAKAKKKKAKEEAGKNGKTAYQQGISKASKNLLARKW